MKRGKTRKKEEKRRERAFSGMGGFCLIGVKVTWVLSYRCSQ